jgi:hypothetical protein
MPVLCFKLHIYINYVWEMLLFNVVWHKLCQQPRVIYSYLSLICSSWIEWRCLNKFQLQSYSFSCANWFCMINHRSEIWLCFETAVMKWNCDWKLGMLTGFAWLIHTLPDLSYPHMFSWRQLHPRSQILLMAAWAKVMDGVVTILLWFIY